MRKYWTIFLPLFLCMFLLMACQSDDPTKTNTEPTTSEATSKPTETTTVPTETQAPTTQATETESQMAAIQQKLQQENALCAVAFVGYCSGSFAEIQEGFVTEGITEVLPIVAEVKEENLISKEGSELYLVVPREDVGVSILEQVFDQNTEALTYGETLYTQSDVEPLLLRGNVSDIFPNLIIRIEGQGGETLEYCPSLSLRDGLLNVETMLICDMTPYETLGIYTGPEYGGESPFMGRWFAEAPNADGETMILELVLSYDGAASYGYGPAESDLYEFFEGQWQLDENGSLCLSLNGGPVGDPEAQYAFYGEFQCEYEDPNLTLTHTDGYSLLYGLEGESLCFHASNQYALIGLWTTSEYDFENDTYIYHDLELMGEDKCVLLIHNGEGNTFAAYEGSWSVEAGELSFFLQSYINDVDMAQDIDGTYSAKIDADGWLTLQKIGGYDFSNYMAECGMELFEPTVSYG